jgi:SAM-dependent methyltransferase
MTGLSALLACPRCDTPLDSLHCPACRMNYPDHAGVPWLFSDPEAAVSEWRNRWQLADARMRRELAAVNQALDAAPAKPTRRRLEALAEGYAAQLKRLDTLLQPLRRAPGGSLETLLALRTRLPPAQGIFSYEANVHRDWNWGDSECAVAIEALLPLLGQRTGPKVLVLGAGAGRLAYDLHRALPSATTVAVDLNPLLAYVGRQVADGKSATLVEFPRAPRTQESAAIERTLQAPTPTRPGLEFVLADALRPPFRPESFDVVVTPWLLDVIDARPDEVLRRVNGLLAPGGLWVNQGSVAFEGPDPAWRLTLDELLGVAESAGLGDPHWIEHSVPYMDCPDSRHGRRECVVTCRMHKTRAVPTPARHDSLPDWIVQGRKPIPLLPAFLTQAMNTRMHAFILSLIDGKRTLKDMAQVLEVQRLMPRQEAETALRGFLAKMYEEAKR